MDSSRYLPDKCSTHVSWIDQQHVQVDPMNL